jgi:hypothetical protein
MCSRALKLLLPLVAAMPLATVAGSAEGPAVDPRADAVLKRMGDYLKASREFSFETDVIYDSVLNTGQKIQFGRSAQVLVRKPNRLYAEVYGDLSAERLWIDGTHFTLLNPDKNRYATVKVPGTLDEALDFLAGSYGIVSPIEDVVYSDPYAIVSEHIDTGRYVGQHIVRGVRCHHLAFTQASVDWQVWVEDGPQPVPRKVVINYKKVKSSPQFIVWLSNWDFAPRFSDSAFEFLPPPGATETKLEALVP